AGVHPGQLHNLNNWLRENYGDTLSNALYDALQYCSSLPDTLYRYRAGYRRVAFPCNTGNACAVPLEAMNKNNGQQMAAWPPEPGCPAGTHWDNNLNRCVPDYPPANGPGTCYTWCFTHWNDTI